MHMVAVYVTAPVLFFLLFAEHMRRIKHYSGETTRKFVHIAVATFVAFWPFFLNDLTITIACLAFFAAIVASRYLDIFPSIHRVSRKTWGDILFPVGILATLYVANSPWIFAAAMLHLGLADGMAAILGCKYGMKHKFKVFGHTKTILGTTTFFVISVLITYWLMTFTPSLIGEHGYWLLLVLPIMSTGIELVAGKGTDNLFVPIAVAALLNMFVTLV